MDQNLLIGNSGSSAVVPVLAYQPYGANGRDLTEIQVTTAFGSDRGELVVPEQGWYEVLSFRGDDVSKIVDVQVTVVGVEAVKYPNIKKEFKTQFLDAAGEPTYGGDFESVRVTNDGALNVMVRLVYLVLDNPPSGSPQQPIRIIPLAGLTKIPARSDVVVPISADVASVQAEIAGKDVFISVKAFPSR